MTAGLQFDGKGRITRLPLWPGLPHGPAATPAVQYGWRRLKLADAIASGDPASRLTGAVTDALEGGGISYPLTASWQSSDAPGNYPYHTWPLLDVHGQLVGGDVTFCVPFYVRFRATYSETDDVVIGIALSTESAFTGSTIESKGIHLICNGAGGSGVVATGNSTATNGSGTQTNAAAGQSGVVSAIGAVFVGGGGASRLFVTGSIGLDSSGNVVASSGSAQTTTVTLSAPPSLWYLHSYAGRVDNTNASTKTVTADLYYGAPLVYPFPVM